MRSTPTPQSNLEFVFFHDVNRTVRPADCRHRQPQAEPNRLFEKSVAVCRWVCAVRLVPFGGTFDLVHDVVKDGLIDFEDAGAERL